MDQNKYESIDRRYGYFPYPEHYQMGDEYDVRPEYIDLTAPYSQRYWEIMLKMCTPAQRIRKCRVNSGDREVFGLGRMIIKSSHLHGSGEYENLPWDPAEEIDYTYADANEVEAIRLARTVLDPAILTPKIYFNGKVNGRQVLVRERLPGYSLNTVWHVLEPEQKQAVEDEAREILRKLHSIKPPNDDTTRNHVVPDPNIRTNGRIESREADLIFLSDDPDLGFMHNDFTMANIIVQSPDNPKIVGLIDWEEAGWFG